MSRSRRKHPWMGVTTCRSEKDDKRFARKSVRARERALAGKLDDAPVHKRAVSNVWGFGKDGRQRVTDGRYMRK